MTTIVYELKDNIEISTPEDLLNPIFAAAAEKLYTEHLDGIYRSSPSSMAYFPLSTITTPSNIQTLHTQISQSRTPDLQPSQKSLLLSQLNNPHLGHMETILHHGNSDPLFRPHKMPGKRYATLYQILLYPFAREYIHISSSSINSPPIIEPNYYQRFAKSFSSETFSPDLELLAHGTIFASKIPSLSPLNSIISHQVFPPSSPTHYYSLTG